MSLKRNSNYELLRIISMFFIVLWHVILNGNILLNTIDVTNHVFYFIMFFVVIHVNLFLLITGYFQVDSSFKIKKVISLLFQLGFYNLLINSVLYITGLVEYSNVEYLKSILFFNTNSYWFIQCYIIVYCLSPIFNKLINSISLLELKKYIIIIITLFSLIPVLSSSLFYYHNGLGLVQFVLMYFIGAYIKKTQILDVIFNKYNIIQKRCIYILIFLISLFFNICIFYYKNSIGLLDSNIFNNISSIIGNYSFNYSNPLIIIQSLSVFFLFSTFKINNRFINYISGLTLGVYLLHDNIYLRKNIFKWFLIDQDRIIYGKKIILYVFVVAIIIFVIGLIVEFIRKNIVNIFTKIKIIKSIDSKMLDCINSIIDIK